MTEIVNERLLTNWHLMRWVALGVGLFFIVQGLRYQDWISGLVGGVFIIQAVTNTGCLCGSCNVSPSVVEQTGNRTTNEVNFTEVKEDQHGRG
jgi:hypothetical protein